MAFFFKHYFPTLLDVIASPSINFCVALYIHTFKLRALKSPLYATKLTYIQLVIAAIVLLLPTYQDSIFPPSQFTSNCRCVHISLIKSNHKKMKTSAKLLFLMASMAFFEAAIATPESVLENKVAEGQAKTFFSSGGNYYLALNTTYLIYYGVLLGLALLALLALAPLFGGSSDAGYGNYQHYQQRFGQENPNSDFHHQRQRRGLGWDNGMEFSYIYIK